MESKKIKRCTSKQINMLIDYMSTHGLFANGEFSGPLGQRQLIEEWERLAEILKNYGPMKTIEQWRNTWRDIKRRAREEGANYNKACDRTGNIDVPKLSEQSKKVLGIIGIECAMGISGAKETGIGEILVVADNTRRTSLNYPSTSSFVPPPLVLPSPPEPFDPILNSIPPPDEFMSPAEEIAPQKLEVTPPQPLHTSALPKGTTKQVARGRKNDATKKLIESLEKKKESILKDISNELHIANQYTAQEARRNHLKR